MDPDRSRDSNTPLDLYYVTLAAEFMPWGFFCCLMNSASIMGLVLLRRREVRKESRRERG